MQHDAVALGEADERRPLLVATNTLGWIQIEHRLLAPAKLHTLVERRKIAITPTGRPTKWLTVSQHDQGGQVFVFGPEQQLHVPARPWLF